MRNGILALGCIAILAATAYALIELSLSPTCDLTELDARRSPNDNYVTGVALRRIDQSLTSDNANAVLIVDGIVPIVAHWIADDLLEIEVPASGRVFGKKYKFNNISVRIINSNNN
jgi:hypothetical protein